MKPPLSTLARLFVLALERGGSPSLTDLARKAGVGRVTLSRWRNGITKPDPDELERVLAALGFALGLRALVEESEKS